MLKYSKTNVKALKKKQLSMHYLLWNYKLEHKTHY